MNCSLFFIRQVSIRESSCFTGHFKLQSHIGCDRFLCNWLAVIETVMPIFGMSLWSPINLRQVLQLVSDWSETYRQLLTVRTAIGLRSVETGRRKVGEWSVTVCNWAVTGRWLTVDRFSIKTKAYKKDAFHNRTISTQVFKMLTTGQLQLLRL